jgi:hypothetical protein
MHDDHLVDLPDDQYRAHWLAFHEQVDWSAHQDVTAIPVTFEGPEALYRRNKGSFMERLEPAVHCRPYAAHARHARRSGAWISEEKIFEASLAPALDLMPPMRRRPIDLGAVLRRYFRAAAPTHAATASSRRLASTP